MKPHFRLHTNGQGSWWMEEIRPHKDTQRRFWAPQHAVGHAGYGFWKSPMRSEFRDSLRAKRAAK